MNWFLGTKKSIMHTRIHTIFYSFDGILCTKFSPRSKHRLHVERFWLCALTPNTLEMGLSAENKQLQPYDLQSCIETQQQTNLITTITKKRQENGKLSECTAQDAVSQIQKDKERDRRSHQKRDCIMLFLDNVLSLFCCVFFYLDQIKKKKKKKKTHTIKTESDENENSKNNLL